MLELCFGHSICVLLLQWRNWELVVIDDVEKEYVHQVAHHYTCLLTSSLGILGSVGGDDFANIFEIQKRYLDQRFICTSDYGSDVS